MAHDNENMLSRIAAIKLMSKLSLKLGKNLCEHFIGFEMMCMADDSEQKVRMTTISSFLIICQMVSNEFFLTKLLPAYQR